MKKIITLILVAAAFLAVENKAEAQSLKDLVNKVKSSTTKTTESEATKNGKAAGAALKALYTKYKADKKLNMSNLQNIANVATLASSLQELKGKSVKSTYYKEFAAGLVEGSGDLVNEKNSSSVMSSLSGLVDSGTLSNVQNKASATASDLSSAADSISEILSLFN